VISSGGLGSVVFLQNRRNEFQAHPDAGQFVGLHLYLPACDAGVVRRRGAAALFQRSSAGAAGRVVCLLGYGDHFAVLLLAGSTAFNYVVGWRNIIGTRHIDPRILKVIGLRFVITDLPISDANLRAQIPIPVSPEARRLLGFADHNLNNFDLFLYELDGVNLGQFSPTETKLAVDANQTLT
jgi:hypothetical protein